jgi:hypothetical protein
MRAGIAIAPTPYNDVIVAALEAWRLLTPGEEHTAAEIGEASFRAMDDAARSR